LGQGAESNKECAEASAGLLLLFSKKKSLFTVAFYVNALAGGINVVWCDVFLCLGPKVKPSASILAQIRSERKLVLCPHKVIKRVCASAGAPSQLVDGLLEDVVSAVDRGTHANLTRSKLLLAQGCV